MIQEEPQVSKTGRYSLAEAARRMNCDTRTLHKYAAYFRVAPSVNKVSGRPTFTGAQLLRIWRAAF